MTKIIIVLLYLLHCSKMETELTKDKLLPVISDRKDFKVLFSDPKNAEEGITALKSIRINFNSTPKFDSCYKAFSILPYVRGKFKEFPLGLEFIPESNWDSLTYSVTLSKICEDTEGNDLLDVHSFFFTGARITVSPEIVPTVTSPEKVIPSPLVQAIGLESQGCSSTYPAIGSITGGDWNSSQCFWDNSLPVLQPVKYLFRGGDNGGGSLGSSVACVDSKTDNFKIIFSEYMSPSTAQSFRLKRNSPPASNILLSSWEWLDCNTSASFGCRVLVLRFSEMEASCNGSLFGNSSTAGDFNLQRTDNAPLGYPTYTLIMDSNLAISSEKKKVESDFYFSMEGK
jgi:hypothetical protein